MEGLRKVLLSVGGIIVLLCVMFLFFLPLPERVTGNAEEFICQWEDGAKTREDSLFGIKILGVEREKILFERDGKRGICDTGAEFRRAVDIFEEGDAYSLLTFRLGECSKPEHLALLVEFGNVCFYAEGALFFDGTALVPSDRTKFDTVVLLSGTPSESFLEESGAEKVIDRKNAQKNFARSDMGGSNEEIF